MSKDIYKKVCDGSRITDVELETAIKDYTNAEKALLKLGPFFEINRKAVSTTLITLEDMYWARRR